LYKKIEKSQGVIQKTITLRAMVGDKLLGLDSRNIPLGETSNLQVMSKNPESVPFVRLVLQISQTGERWFLLARHAMIVY